MEEVVFVGYGREEGWRGKERKMKNEREKRFLKT